MILYSLTLGHPVAYTTTDQHGYFSFPNVPLGEYRVIADKPAVDPYLTPELTLTATAYDSLDFRLHSTYLELVWPAVGQQGGLPELSVHLFPNPAAAQTYLRLQLPETNTLNWRVWDLQGRCLHQGYAQLEAGTHLVPLTAKEIGLAAGSYFVQVEVGGELRVLRMEVHP
jgi:hypothetical protein